MTEPATTFLSGDDVRAAIAYSDMQLLMLSATTSLPCGNVCPIKGQFWRQGAIDRWMYQRDALLIQAFEEVLRLGEDLVKDSDPYGRSIYKIRRD